MIYVFAIVAAGFGFLKLYPAFGGNPTREQREAYRQFANYRKGKFLPPVPTDMSMGVSAMVSMLKDSLARGVERTPKVPVPLAPFDWDKIRGEEDSLTWFGHSAFLLSIDNKKILLDPMFGPVPSPVSFAGGKRYSVSMLDVIDELPPIDAVLLTHDHYDHLDYPSILKLKGKAGRFFVPHGVGAHLIRWGVESSRITELNWWEEAEFEGLSFAATPARHFSGRGILNRNSTLWCGWAIFGKNRKVFISGDGGYGPHFNEIGSKYGPFDLTLIEGGQYDRRWPGVHMMPEQSVQAHLDVRGRTMMLMHWGAFTLAFHSWTEPVERAAVEAGVKGVDLIAPRIGETVLLDAPSRLERWWERKQGI